MHKEKIAQLIDGQVNWEELKTEVLPDPKDSDRFEKTIAVLQDRVDWDEQILIPLNDHLFVVSKNGDRIIKADCGHEYGQFGENWKKQCQVRIRESKDDMSELYPELMVSDPEWTFQIREFFCPNCFTQLDVDTVPAGYPTFISFEPDIDTFYQEYLGKSVPDRQ